MNSNRLGSFKVPRTEGADCRPGQLWFVSKCRNRAQSSKSKWLQQRNERQQRTREREKEEEKAHKKTVTNTQIRVHTSTAGTCPAYLPESKREARTLLHFGCHRSFFMLPARSQGPLAGEGDWHRTNVIIDWCSPKFMDDLNADESSI